MTTRVRSSIYQISATSNEIENGVIMIYLFATIS